MNIIPITISPDAQEEIRNSLNIKGIPAEYNLRVGLKGGACSANYLLGFDKMTENDELYEVEGIKILIDRRHLMYLIGVELDFEEEGNGFTFTRK
ncbi:iron-sulfur cluster assembly protein [Pseudarcicella hirudinis]|uniref:Iron-sulfur cluster assembly protein n=1 Tax=Pseudarcicella hirudinis TaxID=1079859 RepID=A0A1I5PDU4_9BACT|nr:iron-sulfur cluster assembly accessory protein [Pseudarcicella hirudinis]SFP32249.1 iron-sulfur cluster assembly protein [Pseudarcicella hirudinis]